MPGFADLVTLVCVTYNRQSYLLRSWDYWLNLPYRVIYVDGSEFSFSQKLTQSNSKHLNYFHKPASLLERISFGVGLVDTPYVLMLCDDEYYLPSSINACIEYLQEMSSYVSCGGRALGFKLINQKVALFNVFPTYKEKDLFYNDPLIRLRKNFSSYELCQFYCVNRTSAMKQAISLATSHSASVLKLAEASVESSLVVLGKVRTLNRLFWLRSYEVPPCRNHDPYFSSDNLEVDILNMAVEDYKKQLHDLLFSNDISLGVSELYSVISNKKNYVYRSAAIDQVQSSPRLSSIPQLLQPIILFAKLSVIRFFQYLRRPSLVSRMSHYALQCLRNEGVFIDQSDLNCVMNSIKDSIKLI